MEPVTVAVVGAAGLLTKDSVSRILGPLADDVGERLKEIVDRRWPRVIAVDKKAREIVGDKPVQTIPDRVLIPLLNGAANEDDEELQDKWASLLANAALDPNQALTSFPGILS